MAKGIKKFDIAAEDNVLNLKEREKGVPFSVKKIGDEVRPVLESQKSPEAIHDRMEDFAEKLEQAVIKVTGKNGEQNVSIKDSAKDLIRVKFEKFVQLVATRNFVEVLEKNKNEDIILSSNLLTDLASAVEEKSEKKTPIIFVVGLAIGVILTYIMISK